MTVRQPIKAGRRAAACIAAAACLASFVSVVGVNIYSATPTAASKPRPDEPRRGTAERRALLDAIRPTIALKLNAPIEFVVLDMRVLGDWAFVQVRPQRPGGKRIDLRRTPLHADADFMDGVRTEAILKRTNGKWYIVEYAIGATDVWYAGWCGRTPAPLLADVCGN